MIEKILGIKQVTIEMTRTHILTTAMIIKTHMSLLATSTLKDKTNTIMNMIMNKTDKEVNKINLMQTNSQTK